MRNCIIILTLSLLAVAAKPLFYNDPVFMAQTNYQAPSSGASGINNPFVLNWSNRVVTAGGTVGSVTLSNAQVFLNAIQSITNKILTVSIIPTDSIVAVQCPLMYSAGYSVWTNSGFSASTLTKNGLGIGNPNYFDTGVNPSLVFTNQTKYSNCVSTYSLNQNASNQNADNGSYVAGGYIALLMQYNGVNNFWDDYNSTAPDRTLANVSFSGGFNIGSRTSSSYSFIAEGYAAVNYSNLVLNVAGPATYGPPNLNFYFGNCNGSPMTGNTGVTNSFYWLSFGLTTNEAGLLYTNVQQLRVNMGGGYK
mgnify:CR=1 FL=1